MRAYPDVGTSINLAKPVVMSKKVLERGFPLGFDNAGEFLAYKKSLLDSLPEQHRDAIVGMRGSSVHGNKFVKFPKDNRTSDTEFTGAHTGPFFRTEDDPSDWDIFIVSPELFRIAKEKGLTPRSNPKSSWPIETLNDFRELGLEQIGKAILDNGKHKGSIKIFGSLDGLARRGSYMKFD